ncbi:hypothetical protein AHAS_Ahas17G0271700 [Arachis hypogaea]
MYCPFKDCSALMIVDDDSPTESECPSCNRQICVTCEAVWHHGITCKEFGRTDNEYRVVMEVAARNQWMRCPNCSNSACASFFPAFPSALTSGSFVCILFQQSYLHSVSTVQSALCFSSSICTLIALHAPFFYRALRALFHYALRAL